MPVSLCGKLFRTELLQKCYRETPKVVHFWGDDLVITLAVMPQARKVAITPENVYIYRIGGGTSRYDPHMFDDWLALYRYKSVFALRYPMPQDIRRLMDIELCNMVFTYFRMLGRSERYTRDMLIQEIQRVCKVPEVRSACQNTAIERSQYRNVQLLYADDTEKIMETVEEDMRRYKKTKWIRKLIYKLA